MFLCVNLGSRFDREKPRRSADNRGVRRIIGGFWIKMVNKISILMNGEEATIIKKLPMDRRQNTGDRRDQIG